MFYTYIWLREDGTPYYVGKGKDNRAFRHGCPMKDIIPGFIEEPDKDRIILQNHPTEKDAFEVEIFLIAYFGRKDLGTGILRNLTDGGEGTKGKTLEARKKISKAMSSRFISEETKDKIRKSLLGAKQLQPTIEKRSKALSGKPWTKARRLADEAIPRIIPTCHPERKHKAHGLCVSCAYKEWKKNQ